MRRRRLGEPADRQKVKVLLKENNPGWKQTRLTALKMGFNSQNSNAFIAESLGVSEPSVKRWFATFRKAGIEAVLERKYSSGRPSDLNEEIESYLLKGLEKGRWNTAGQARGELEKHFEQRFKYKTVWVWLKKCAGVLRVPRPVHEKRDSAKAEAFKRNFLGILKKAPGHSRETSKDLVCGRMSLRSTSKPPAGLDTQRATPAQTLAKQIRLDLLLRGDRSN